MKDIIAMVTFALSIVGILVKTIIDYTMLKDEVKHLKQTHDIAMAGLTQRLDTAINNLSHKVEEDSETLSKRIDSNKSEIDSKLKNTEDTVNAVAESTKTEFNGFRASISKLLSDEIGEIKKDTATLQSAMQEHFQMQLDSMDKRLGKIDESYNEQSNAIRAIATQIEVFDKTFAQRITSLEKKIDSITIIKPKETSL